METATERLGESDCVEGSKDWYDLKLAEGTDDAWDDIIRVEAPIVERIMRKKVGTSRVDHRDLTQYALQRLWDYRSSNNGRPALSYFGYRTKVCNAVWVDWLRAHGDRREISIHELAGDGDENYTWEALMKEDADPRIDKLKDCVTTLPKHLEVLHELRYLEGRSLEEIAEMLGLDVRTIKRRHRELKDQLKRSYVAAG